MKDELIRKLKELVKFLRNQIMHLDRTDWYKRREVYNAIVALEKQIEQDELAEKIANTDYMDTERDTITTYKEIDENERP